MLWPILITALIAAAALAAVHAGWRRKFQRATASANRERARLVDEYAQARAQLEAQQDALLNSMAEGLLLLDESGRIQLANQAFLSLFQVSGSVRSKTIMEALRLHELAELVDFMGTEQRAIGCEIKLPPPNERWLEVNGAAIFHGESERRGTVLVFHDLTRLKRLENARQEFVANVSHELRTPLSLVKGYVETLLDGARDNPEVAEKFLRTIERNTERLSLLIEDLLTLSELESGRLRLQPGAVALRKLADEVCGDYRERARTRRVTLVNDVPDITVHADTDRIEQVIGNLVDNAIKYGRADSEVTIGGRMAEGDQAEVFVQDRGPGIPPEALERIFERFYRLDAARSRKQGGTGLGLSIVKHIVQSHGGRVWATSEPGQGARFFFTLPLEKGGCQQPLL